MELSTQSPENCTIQLNQSMESVNTLAEEEVRNPCQWFNVIHTNLFTFAKGLCIRTQA
jgi:hypothetical protein